MKTKKQKLTGAALRNESFTRNDLAVVLSEKYGVSVEAARTTVEHFIEAISQALRRNQKIEFRGFGVLQVITRKPKIGRNPKKPKEGEYRIPARRVVKFRAGSELENAINRNGSSVSAVPITNRTR